MIEKYLDTIFEQANLNIKLDQEQKQVILDNHENCLVIAGAGSGKTTVISAKVKYLIDIKKVDPNNILVISFTKESVNDLKKQIINNLNLNINIETFHKLALEIIGKNQKFTICDNLENILNIYFSRDIYFTDYYLEYLEYLYTFFYKQNTNYYKIDNYKVITLEEVAIINFLKLTNIKFKYEIVNFNQIISKFILYINNKKIIINYLKKDRKIIRKKANSFNIIKGTSILTTLKNILLKLDIFNYKIMEDEDIEYRKFLSLCTSFINNYKVNYIDNQYLKKLKTKYINNYQLTLFITIITRALKYYTNHNQNNNIIDFNDIINQAVKKLKNISFTKYKYVIIDEFQDISKNRLEIIKLLSQNHSKIIAFGDDWQAIFGFAGSDVNLFINFPKIFRDCNILKISKTYRNSQQLINLAGNFIMNNNYQLKKQLLSDKTLFNPVIVYFYDKNNIKSELIYNIILEIINVNPSSRILILGRYKFSLKEIIDKKYFDIIDNKLVCLNLNVDITFLTAHASKGLTFDETIILDVNDNIYGFPSQIVDNYELQILKNEEKYYLEEERRLFYVALTRTKNHNYIISDIENPSIYLLELLKNKNIKNINLTKTKLKINKTICYNCGYFFSKNKKRNLICPKCHNKISYK